MCAAVVINPNPPLCQLWCFTLARSGRSFPGVWCTLPIAATTGPVCMGGSPGAASVPPSSPIRIRFQCRAGCFTRSNIGCCRCARVLARSPFPTTFASADRWSTATGKSVTPCRPFSLPHWPKSLPSVYAKTLKLFNLKLRINLFQKSFVVLNISRQLFWLPSGNFPGKVRKVKTTKSTATEKAVHESSHLLHLLINNAWIASSAPGCAHSSTSAERLAGASVRRSTS